MIAVVSHGRDSALQAGRRVVSENEVQARVEVRAALFVERLEAVEPCGRARAGTDADLEPVNLGRQLAARLEIAQQRPEVGDRIGDRLRMVRVGRSAGQRRLEALARGRFPVAQVPPEQPVEAPHQAIAVWTELVEIEVVLDVGLGTGVEALHRPREVGLKPGGVGLTKIDGDLGQRERLPLGTGRPAQHHRVAEVGLVLNPVQMNPQGWGHPGVEDAVFDERHQRPRDQARHLALWRTLAVPGLLALRNVVDVNDHRTDRLYSRQVQGIGAKFFRQPASQSIA